MIIVYLYMNIQFLQAILTFILICLHKHIHMIYRWRYKYIYVYIPIYMQTFITQFLNNSSKRINPLNMNTHT